MGNTNEERTRVSLLLRMLIGGLVGVLTIAGWGLLALSVLESTIGGGAVNIALFLLGVTALIAGPLMLSLSSHAKLSRALLVSLTAPFGATTVCIIFFVTLGMIELVLGFLPSEMTTLLIAAYVATLVGITELFTRQFNEKEIALVFYSVGAAISIPVGIEFTTGILPVVLSWNVADAGWILWVVAGLYAILVGFNTVYFENFNLSSIIQSHDWIDLMFVGVNVLIILFVTVIRLFG